MSRAEINSQHSQHAWELELTQSDYPVDVRTLVTELEKVCNTLLTADPRSILAAHDPTKAWYPLHQVVEKYATTFIDHTSLRSTYERTAVILFLGALLTAMKEGTAIAQESILIVGAILFLLSEVERPLRRKNTQALWRAEIIHLMGETLGSNTNTLDDVTDVEFADIVDQIRPLLAAVMQHYQADTEVNFSY